MDAPNSAPHQRGDRRRHRLRPTAAGRAAAVRTRPGRALRRGSAARCARPSARSASWASSRPTPGAARTCAPRRVAGVHRQVGLAIRRRGVTAAQLSEARITLESEAAGLAAARATDEDIERLEAALERPRERRGHRARAARPGVPPGHRGGGAQPGHRDDAGVDRAAHRRAHDAQRRGPRRHEPEPALPRASRWRPSARHDPEAARAAIVAHLSVARELYGDDYERSVDSLAQRALSERGALASLDDVVTAGPRRTR